jgi:hypothetical protein
MTRQVWKFPVPDTLQVNVPFTVEAPGIGRAVHFDMQETDTGYHPTFLWTEVDPDAPFSTTQFMVVGTGWDVPDDYEHVGTYLNGPLVWHLYQAQTKGNPDA